MAVINAWCEKCEVFTKQSYSPQYGDSYCDICGRNTIDDCEPAEPWPQQGICDEKPSDEENAERKRIWNRVYPNDKR